MIKTSQAALLSRFTRYFLFLILFTTFTAQYSHSRQAENQNDVKSEYRTAIEDQARQILEELTLRQRIAQLFVIRADGGYYSDDHRRFLHWKRLVEEHEIGGIIFFRGDTYNQAILTNRLQQLSRIPLWIAQDMEYGAAMRVTDAIRITPAMGVAASGNPHLAFEKGRITAMEARALGVHQVYAPVVDVNNNPSNPVINVRSFSEDPEVVSEYAEAFIRGVHSQGLMATAKHFPGHGDTDTDSHLALPVVRHSPERLESIELAPFRSVIDAGVGSIMTAHIAFPNIGSDPGRPATLDSYFMTELLQNELGFKGLIVTDALEMAGISRHYSPGDAAVEAIRAGSDVILLSPDEMAAIHHIERAVAQGLLSEERINHSAKKILLHKIDAGLMRRATVDINRISSQIHTRSNKAAADAIARESITLLKNNRSIVPIHPDRYPRITMIAISNHESGNTGRDWQQAMNRYHPNIQFFNYDSRTSSDELDEMIQSARGSGLVIIGSFLHLATGERLSFDRNQRAFINRIKALNKPSVLVSFSSPYIVSEYPEADVHLLAWSMAGSQPEAAATALFGASEINGKLPISIPGHYTRWAGIHVPKTILRRDMPESVNMSTVRLLEVDRIMNRAIADSVFPGGKVAVIKDGVLAYHEAYGYTDYDKRTPLRTNHLFDLASLTKPLATTLAVMKLKDNGTLRLDDKVSAYFSEFSQGPKSEVTIRHLLNHTSGLPAYRTYVDEHKTRVSLLDAVKNEPLINNPGLRVIYSDLGYILLAEIVASAAGQSFEQYLRNELYGPLRLTDTMFNPASRGQRIVNRSVPTEVDTVYRMRTIQGEVHDERAFYLGGVAGHAGLFSTTGDLAVLVEMLMRGGNYAGRNYIEPETIARFTKRTEDSPRASGFDLKSLDGFTTAGQLASDDTYGHLGFTGTSFWIDPERNLAVIILTNRTYPYRGTSSGINRVRTSVMDAVIESIRD